MGENGVAEVRKKERRKTGDAAENAALTENGWESSTWISVFGSRYFRIIEDSKSLFTLMMESAMDDAFVLSSSLIESISDFSLSVSLKK